jgi:hypothetical protein
MKRRTEPDYFSNPKVEPDEAGIDWEIRKFQLLTREISNAKTLTGHRPFENRRFGGLNGFALQSGTQITDRPGNTLSLNFASNNGARSFRAIIIW